MEINIHQKIIAYRNIVNKIYHQIQLQSFIKCNDTFLYNGPIIILLTLLQGSLIESNNIVEPVKCDICWSNYKNTCIGQCSACHNCMMNTEIFSLDQIEKIKICRNIYDYDYNPSYISLKTIFHNSNVITIYDNINRCVLCSDHEKTTITDSVAFYQCPNKFDAIINNTSVDPYDEIITLCQKHYIETIHISNNDYVNIKLIINYFNKKLNNDTSNEIFSHLHKK